MKKLYLELFLLAVAIVVSVFIIEKIYSSYQTPPDSVIRTFKEQENEVNTVFIGNSHTMALGEPNLFDGKSFNLGFAGINLFDIAMLTKKLVAKQSNIKNVIIGLDYDILGLSSTRSVLSLQLYRYTDSLENSSMAGYLKARSNYFRAGQDFWYLLTRSDYSHLYTGKFSKRVQQNFIPINFKLKSDTNGCIRRALEHGSISYEEKNITKNTELLNELIDFGKANGLNLIFICTPKTKCYMSTYMSIPRIKAAKAYLEEVLKKRETHYYDMTEETVFNDDDFIDYDHLNKTGAAKLATLLQAAMYHEK